MRIHLLPALAALAAATAVHAGPGDFDPAFGANGKTAVAFDQPGGNRADRAIAAIPLAGGGLLVVGSVEPRVNAHDVVGFARLLPNGQRDTTFGTDGKVVQETVFERIVDAGVDNDGRIFVGGQFRDPNGGDLEFGVMRYTAAGQPDLGYGFFGLAVAGFERGGNNNDALSAIRVSFGGEVFAVGSVKIGAAADVDFGVANFDVNGALDTSFSDDGLLTIAFDLDGAAAPDDALALGEWNPNTMRVAGTALRADGTRVVAVASFLTSTGILTPAFCSDTSCQGVQGSLVAGPGKRTFKFDPTVASTDFVTGGALQTGTGGGFAVVGTSTTTGSVAVRGAIGVMTQSGLLLPRAGDPRFGRALIDLGNPTVPTSVVHRFGDAHWIVAGYLGASPAMVGFAGYFDANVDADPSFTMSSLGGPPLPSAYQLIEFPRQNAAQPVETYPASLAIDTEQRIVGAGSRLWARSTGIEDTDYAVFRLDDSDAIFADGFE
jgi:uncharacterized delta-60 repeat protein